MLVLTRRANQEIVIGGDIRVTVLSIVGNQVRLGIEAPPSVRVDRLEIRERIEGKDGLPAIEREVSLATTSN